MKYWNEELCSYFTMFISTLTLPTSIQHAIKEENDTEEAVERRQSNFRHEAQYPVSKLSVTSLHLFFWIFSFCIFFYSFFPSPPSQSEEGKKIIICFTHHSPVAVTSNRVILNSLFRRSLYNHLTRFGITGNNKNSFHSYDRLFPLLFAWWKHLCACEER